MRRLTIILLLLSACLTGFAKVREQAVRYMSVDQHGEPVELSGLLSVPEHPKGLILIPHYTISANDNAPSVKPTGEAKYYREDFVLLMPDYIGYGLTRDRVHPYLAGELTARNTVDMLFGLRPMLDSMALGISLDSIYIVGFSQGGAAALWTLKLLEEQYADRVTVRKCYAGGAPVDVASAYDVSVSRGKTLLPLFIPMLMAGTNEAYDLNLQFDRLYTPAMKRYDEKYVAAKRYNIPQLFFRFPSRKMTHWLTPDGMNLSNAEARRLYEGLKRSSLVHYPISEQVPADTICPAWVPRTQLYVFHSTKDDVVTFFCARHLRSCYGHLPNITWDFDNYGSHYTSARIFYPRVKKFLEQE